MLKYVRGLELIGETLPVGGGGTPISGSSSSASIIVEGNPVMT